MLESDDTKFCHGCDTEKPRSEFNKNTRKKDGLQTQCRECMRSRSLKWASENKARVKQTGDTWRANNRARHSENAKRWRRNNPERWDEIKATTEENRRDSKRIYQRRYESRRNKSDPVYRARRRVSSSVRKKLKEIGACKNGGRTFDHLPYTVSDLKEHLLSTLPEGFTEQDWLDGKLHIDHIIPHSTFHYTSLEDESFRQCWALSNLRLLEAAENIRKSNKLIL